MPVRVAPHGRQHCSAKHVRSNAYMCTICCLHARCVRTFAWQCNLRREIDGVSANDVTKHRKHTSRSVVEQIDPMMENCVSCAHLSLHYAQQAAYSHGIHGTSTNLHIARRP
jgi:hypothetical protein